MGGSRSKSRGVRWIRGGCWVDASIVSKTRLHSRGIKVERWFGGYMGFNEVLINIFSSSLVGTRMYSVLAPIDWKIFP